MSYNTTIVTISPIENETPEQMEKRVQEYLEEQNFCAPGRYALSRADYISTVKHIGLVTAEIYTEQLLQFNGEMDVFSGMNPHAHCEFTDLDQDEMNETVIDQKHLLEVLYHY
jgi:hypothetical protein